MVHSVWMWFRPFRQHLDPAVCPTLIQLLSAVIMSWPIGMWFRLCWNWFLVFEYATGSACDLGCFDCFDYISRLVLYGPLGFSGMFLASLFLFNHSEFYSSYLDVIQSIWIDSALDSRYMSMSQGDLAKFQGVLAKIQVIWNTLQVCFNQLYWFSWSCTVPWDIQVCH